MPSAESGAPIPIGAEGGRKSMRRDTESPAVVRCTNMREQAPVAPEREGAGETVEGTAVVQRHFMRKYERRSTIESRSQVTANESDGRLEATEDEGWRL